MSLFLPARKDQSSLPRLPDPVRPGCKGTILIVTLWILVILTVFALALGQRASLEVKLAGYHRDKSLAIGLAKAAIERAVWEKLNDPNTGIDALSESWGNNEPVFKDYELGEGTVTVSYSFDGATLYGVEDECSKININKADEGVLKRLLSDFDHGEEIAASIVAWWSNKETFEEDSYYEGLDLPYKRKRAPFESVAELLLVQGVTSKILYGEDEDEDGIISEEEEGIAQYLTIYPPSGDRKVNINTAPEKVLSALIENEDLVEDIIDHLRGYDGEIGTDDEVYQTGDLATLGPNISNIFSVTSNTYTIHAQAEVRKVKASITATIGITPPATISYLHWHRE